ncbi:MAG: ankyrin repeat domain-containing protein [Parachlamydiaceae bacterium]|nr:MAG: ankyrin repeat domain-containing protein [Parachlamydiaceae bacterium]
MQFLIESGANVNVADPSSYHVSPLHLAVSLRSKFMLEILLKNSNLDLNAKDENGLSALFYALGSPEIFDDLLSKGLSIDSVTSSGETLLDRCAQFGRIKEMEFLIQKHADVNKGSLRHSSMLFIQMIQKWLSFFSNLVQELLKR